MSSPFRPFHGPWRPAAPPERIPPLSLPPASRPSGLPTISLPEFKYVVDPRCMDDPSAIPGRRGPALAQGFKEAIMAPYGPTWSGVLGDGSSVAGDEEVRGMLSASRALVYLDPGRLPGHVLPLRLASADMQSLKLLICLDRSYNDAVMRRQTSLDVKKTKEDLDCEQPREVAALLTLRGAQAIVMPCAPTLADQNLVLAKQVFEAMKSGSTLGKAVRAKTKTLKTDVDVAKTCYVTFGVPMAKIAE